MKKYLVIILTLCFLGLTGCKTNQEPVDNPAPVPAPPEVVEEEKEIIKHETVADIDIEDCNEYGEISYDFDGDGEEDLLKLLTSAEVHDGDIYVDGRNRWVIVVETAEGIYKLYDNYIQLGEVEVEVGEFYNEEIDKAVIMTINSNAGKTITHFTYVDGLFEEELKYSTDDFSENGASIFNIER